MLRTVKSAKAKSASKSKLSMSQMAYLHIEKKIASRDLRAGNPVSELPIANELGISRTPAREAIRQLVAEGLLEEVPGRGVVVVTLNRHDIAEIYELRKALEVAAVRMATRRLTGSPELNNLRQVADKMESLIEEMERSDKPGLDAKEINRYEAADIAFHTYLLQAAGNRRMLKIVNELRLLIRIFAMRKTAHKVEKIREIHRGHVEVIAAIAAGDPERAAAILSAHIDAGQRERMEQFDLWEREARIQYDINKLAFALDSELN